MPDEFARPEIPDLDQATDRWHEVEQRIDPDLAKRLRHIAATANTATINLLDNDAT